MTPGPYRMSTRQGGESEEKLERRLGLRYASRVVAFLKGRRPRNDSEPWGEAGAERPGTAQHAKRNTSRNNLPDQTSPAPTWMREPGKKLYRTPPPRHLDRSSYTGRKRTRVLFGVRFSPGWAFLRAYVKAEGLDKPLGPRDRLWNPNLPGRTLRERAGGGVLRQDGL